jgi:hypothetical protein
MSIEVDKGNHSNRIDISNPQCRMLVLVPGGNLRAGVEDIHNNSNRQDEAGAVWVVVYPVGGSEAGVPIVPLQETT